MPWGREMSFREEQAPEGEADIRIAGEQNEGRRAYEDNAKPSGSGFLHVSTGI